MKILGIDTSSEQVSVAVGDDATDASAVGAADAAATGWLSELWFEVTI